VIERGRVPGNSRWSESPSRAQMWIHVYRIENGRATLPVSCASNWASTRWIPGDCCKGFNHVRKQLNFHLSRVRKTVAVGHKQIADYALAAFIYEECIAKNAPRARSPHSREEFLRPHSAESSPRIRCNPTKADWPTLEIPSSSRGRTSTEEKCLRSRISTGLLQTRPTNVGLGSRRQNSEFSAFLGA